MQESISAGVIVFREMRGKREYLLIKNRNNDWEFPKGGVEPGEELEQAAVRELKEETGLGKIDILDGFKDKYAYEFYASGEKILKTVYLYLGKSFETSVNLSSEHHDLQWQDYEQAKRTVDHKGPKRILDNAEEFLNNSEFSQFPKA